jgi:hypothetical protein
MMGAERIGDVGMMQLDIWIALCCLLVLDDN